ncbi:hypothetical protein P4533_12565, partial [Geobacillus stearothermophilus]|uniref:hypothetical protein n=1 Tax=Geobacillus stearothermophilus TaxID=1422 RepID=UPI002E1A1213|nr:hypothetical protein [Geobacillus stearothermophilus]
DVAEYILEGYKAEWTAKIKEITTGTKAEFTSWATSMQEIGNRAIQGLIEGMKSMNGPLQAQAKATGESISKTIKSTLKIKSPSQLMRDEVGRQVPAGIVEGIQQNIGSVMSAAKQLALATIPDFSSVSDKLVAFKKQMERAAFTISGAAQELSLSKGELSIRSYMESPNLERKFDQLLSLLNILLSQSHSNTGNVGKEQNPTIEIPIYLDSYEIARATAPHIDTLQGSKLTSRLRFSGVKV